MTFPDRLHALRETHRWSQRDLGQRTGLHWTFISGLERGRYEPGWRTLIALAHAFHLPLHTLLQDVDAEPVSWTAP